MKTRESFLESQTLAMGRYEPARLAPKRASVLVEKIQRLLQPQPLGTDLVNPFLPIGANRCGDGPSSTLGWVQAAAGTSRR